MLIKKVVQFWAYGGCRYNITNAKTGKFIDEGNGFGYDGHNSLPYLKESKIIETWFNVVVGKQTVPFFTTYDDALSFVKEIRQLNKQAKQFAQ